jgi:hypothetical protein
MQLRLHGAVGLVSALVTLKDANFRAISLDRIGRASGQMGIASAVTAADRLNEFLILGDEETPFHSPARNHRRRDHIDSPKRAELRQQACGLKKNMCKTVRPKSGCET